MKLQQDSPEFQAAARIAGEAMRNMIVELLQQDDQTAATVISGAVVAVSAAQISMRPDGMDADEAVLMLLGTVAKSCAQIVNVLEKDDAVN